MYMLPTRKIKHCLLLCLWLTSLGVSAQTKRASSAALSRNISVDDDWSFIRDSVNDAEQVNYDDSKWRKVDLPHDWSIEDLPNQALDSIVGPFAKSSIGKTATGYT